MPTLNTWTNITITRSGTTATFTSIPSWATRITMMLNGVSTSGTGVPLCQIGTGGVATTTGYIGTSGTLAANDTPTAFTNGLSCGRVSTASYARYGHFIFTLISGNTWVGSYIGATASVLTIEQGSCAVTLSGTLDTIRLTAAQTFDAGEVNITWE